MCVGNFKPVYEKHKGKATGKIKGSGKPGDAFGIPHKPLTSLLLRSSGTPKNKTTSTSSPTSKKKTRGMYSGRSSSNDLNLKL